MTTEQPEPQPCPKKEDRWWGHGPAQEPHPCPFASEIHNDDDTLCTCCERCTHECAMDI